MQQLVHAGDRPRLQRGRVGDPAVGRLQPRQAGGGAGGSLFGGARQLDQRLLLVLGAPQERDLIKQLSETLCVQHDRDDVGLATLVLAE